MNKAAKKINMLLVLLLGNHTTILGAFNSPLRESLSTSVDDNFIFMYKIENIYIYYHTLEKVQQGQY